MTTLQLILTSFVASFFVIGGLIGLIHPEKILRILGCQNISCSGTNEVRAMHGGLKVGIGLLLLATISMPGVRSGIFLTVGVVLIGTLVGRIISVLLDGSPSTLTWMITASELLQSGILIFVLHSLY